MKFRVVQPEQQKDDVTKAWLEVDEGGDLRLIMARDGAPRTVLLVQIDGVLAFGGNLPETFGLKLDEDGRIKLVTEKTAKPPAQPEKGT